MLQVFESHAEVIGYDTFTLCSLPYLRQIVEKVKEKLGSDAVPMVSCQLNNVESSKNMYMKRWSRGFFLYLFYRNDTMQNPIGLHTTVMKPLGRAFVWSS